MNNIFNNKILAGIIILIVLGVVVSVSTQPKVLLAPYNHIEVSRENALDIGKSSGSSSSYDVLKNPEVKQAYDIAADFSTEGADNFEFVASVMTRCEGVGSVMQSVQEGDVIDTYRLASDLRFEINKCNRLTAKEKQMALDIVNQNFALKKGGLWVVGTVISCGAALASGGWFWAPCAIQVACGGDDTPCNNND